MKPETQDAITVLQGELRRVGDQCSALVRQIAWLKAPVIEAEAMQIAPELHPAWATQLLQRLINARVARAEAAERSR